MTLHRDVDERAEIVRFLLQLSEMVGRRVRRYGVAGRTVILTVRYADFSTFSKQQVQAGDISRSEQIYCATLKIFDSLLLTHPVRLLGVRLSNLQHHEPQWLLLPEERRRQQLSAALDQVNDPYGEFTLMPENLLQVKGKGSHVISPAWRSEGIRNVEVG